MIRFAIPALVLVAAVSAGAATPQSAEERQEERLAKRLEGMTAGKPQTCLPRDRVGEIKFYNDTAVYVQSRNRVWVNKTNGGCRGTSDDILIIKTYSGQYCRGDIIETRSRGGPGFFTGACSLGDFVPYSK
ncbi:hypothetical protein P1X14_05365 [Sphingomonas sp. AOB5]|uniref:hypothetical protein n=1 Tax=Sphingomonas sp. AOB5 TaxID=3034017 RepID=UPI0023F957D0|nr:hypothetical protein [Sphingomonas sp. AOB5]MDF7774668.1 hypothetical protein [Sphingomonas sp. AOB5]